MGEALFDCGALGEGGIAFGLQVGGGVVLHLDLFEQGSALLFEQFKAAAETVELALAIVALGAVGFELQADVLGSVLQIA
jgi:hypothetical protein